MRNENIDIKDIKYIQNDGILPSLNKMIPNGYTYELDNIYFNQEYKFIMDKMCFTEQQMMEYFHMGYGIIFIINSDDYLKIKDLLYHYNGTEINFIGKINKI